MTVTTINALTQCAIADVTRQREGEMQLNPTIPRRIVTVTADRDRYRNITGWHFQCYECNFSTTFPDNEELASKEYRLTHKCWSKYDPNKRVTIARTSNVHSSSEGTGRA